MKNKFSILAIMFLCGGLYAQEEKTLAGTARVNGGFGGPFFVFGQVENHNGGGGGGGGAFILNDFFIGGFGQGETFGQQEVNHLDYELSLGQGGLWVGYVWPSHRIVHGLASFKLGFGGVTLARVYQDGEPDTDKSLNDNVTVMTPELGIEVNVVHWMRIAITGGYRWVDGVSRIPGFSDTDFRNPVLGCTFRFGNFGYKHQE